MNSPSNDWRNWASKQEGKNPVITHPTIASPRLTSVSERNPLHTRKPAYISTPTTPHEQPCSNELTPAHNHLHLQPTADQLNQILPDPPVCFCKKPAYKRYTIEYGPILECNQYAYTENENADSQELPKKQYICGFHVHEISWNTFCNSLRNGGLIQSDYEELRTCPLYNFTFCSMFYVTNAFRKEPSPTLPNCFCGKPVILRELYERHRPILKFACPNGHIDGKTKCCWILSAREVAFPIPIHHVHSLVDYSTYANYSSASKIKGSDRNVKEHRSDLLATLMTINPQSPSISNYTASPELNETLDFHTLTIQATSTAQQAENEKKGLVIPTSVLYKKQQQPILSTSSSTSSVNSVLSNHMQQQLEKQQYQNYHNIKRDYELKLSKLSIEIRGLQSENQELTNKANINEQVASEQKEMRIQCQEKLSSVELDHIRLKNEKEKVKNDLDFFLEKEKKTEESDKCRVCFSRDVEYVLVPCYHYAYCRLCAYMLEECAICRTAIVERKKIYTC